MSEKLRTLEVVAKSSFFELLDELQKKSGKTKAQIIDEAIGLYSVAYESIKKGGTLVIADKFGKIIASNPS
jgi:predicted DNA-binding protein